MLISDIHQSGLFQLMMDVIADNINIFPICIIKNIHVLIQTLWFYN